MYKIILFVIGVLFATVSYACTTIIVGSQVSASGNPMVIRNEDVGVNNWPKKMEYRPAQNFAKGAIITYDNALKIPAPRHLYAYSALPDWNAKSAIKDGHSFDERGINTENVFMTATNSFDMNKKAEKADPLVKKGSIVESNMTSLILSRAKTAKEGVQLLGKYVEKYGAGEASGIIIGDSHEIWYVEIGSGHQWLALKIPANKYLVVANSMRLNDVNLDSPNVMHSKGLFTMVQTNKLLDNAHRTHFNFAKALGVTNNSYDTDRVWLVQKILSPNIIQKSRMEQYPMLMDSSKKITLSQIINVERIDSYKGTAIAKTAIRPIAVLRNSETHAFVVNSRLPKPFQITLYQSLGDIKYGIFVPYYNMGYKIPRVYHTATNVYSQRSAWWAFRLVGTFGAEMGSKENVWIADEINQFQTHYKKLYIRSQKQLASLYKRNPKLAMRKMAIFNRRIANRAYKDVTKLDNRLVTLQTVMKQNDSYNKKYSPETIGKKLILKGVAPS